jgi:hypothetical protein
MSLDDRIRAGLEANAARFLPEGEVRLERVHARLRRRRALQSAAVAASLAAAFVIIMVVGSPRLPADREEPLPQPAPTVPTPSPGVQVLPDSTWSRTLTRADADRAGIPKGRPILRDFGADGRLSLSIGFQGDAFSLQVLDDDGVAEVGDSGDVTYDAPGRLIATSDSTGCFGCEYLLTWEVRGDRLVLGSAPGADLSRVEAFVMLGAWRRSE